MFALYCREMNQNLYVLQKSTTHQQQPMYNCTQSHHKTAIYRSAHHL